MILTISGTPGAGKTTVAKILSKRLNLTHYYMGGIMRDLAKKKGMTLNEFNKLRDLGPEIDNFVDDYLIKAGKTQDNFIAEGRTAFHFIPNSIKLFLTVDPIVGAKRIQMDVFEKRNDSRNESVENDVSLQIEKLELRVNNDKKRYLKYYGIDMDDMSNYDFYFDTSSLTPEQTADKIIEFINKNKNKN